MTWGTPNPRRIFIRPSFFNVEYKLAAKPESRVEAIDGAVKFFVVRAQRLYNNNGWPNPVVVKLKGVAFVE